MALVDLLGLLVLYLALTVSESSWASTAYMLEMSVSRWLPFARLALMPYRVSV